MSGFEAPPEALLIERLREALPDKQSAVSRVAEQAGISESRWRQIAKGYQQADKETRVRVVAPAGTLARMAAAVSATPEDLEQAGRKDAAAQFRKLQAPIQPSEEYAGLGVASDGALLAEVLRRIEGVVVAQHSREIVAQLRVLFTELRRRHPEISTIDNPEDWPESLFEGISDEPPPVRRRKDSDQSG